MSLILPHYEFHAQCTHCDADCRVRIFNGMRDWVLEPSLANDAKQWGLVTVMRVAFEDVQEALRAACNDAPHGCELCVMWAQDQKTYDLLVKLAENYPQLREMDDGEEDDEGSNRTHGPH